MRAWTRRLWQNRGKYIQTRAVCARRAFRRAGRRAHAPRGVSRVVRHRRAAADDDRSASGAANDVRVVGGGGRDVHDVERGGGRGGGGEGKDNRMSSSKISEPEPLSIARRRVT